MDFYKVLSELKAERDRIVRAIVALTEKGTKKQATSGRKIRYGRGITPEGRRRLSLAMKKRWAERRKKGG